MRRIPLNGISWSIAANYLFQSEMFVCAEECLWGVPMVVSVEVVRHPSHPARPLYYYYATIGRSTKVYFGDEACASLSGIHRRHLHSSDNRAPADTRRL